ncbi:MAG: uroporphyrinogen-III synthase, partial [Proteobacteria bacterium]|nr:uroporphyrinogen-III synthase [Pseudomonadota bacterium]MBU1711249.1 uroporphyrinogen-III synthase [Pseudomonadota bacterium]
TLLEEQGADCIERATIALADPDSWDDLDRELVRIASYQWLLFTSINAVRYFLRRVFAQGMDVRDLKGPSIGVVGKATADCLLEYGIRADLLPEEFTGEGLADSLIKKGVNGAKILLPRALKAHEILPEKLRAANAEVTVVPVYQNIMPQLDDASLKREIEEGNIDVVTFTSSSTVTNFLAMLGLETQEEIQKLLAGVKIAAIGPITAKTIRKNGLTVDIQPENFTIPDLVDSIVTYFTK